MPTIGFKGATVAPYNNNAGVVTYGTPISAGCPMQAQLELRFAEGRLYACDSLAEYIREVIGGSVTFGAKYFPQAAQLAMFGATTKDRSVTYNDGTTSVTKTVTSIVVSADNRPGYVGFAGFAPDVIDGQNKYTAFFVPKVKFSQPNTNFQTKNDTITFQTPTTTGEFLPDDTTGRVVQEVAICDTEAEALAWCQAVFPQPAP